MRSAFSQLLISFSTSISLPLNIVIFIVERFSRTHVMPQPQSWRVQDVTDLGRLADGAHGAITPTDQMQLRGE
jgi:hypothetical protein